MTSLCTSCVSLTTSVMPSAASKGKIILRNAVGTQASRRMIVTKDINKLAAMANGMNRS